MNYACLVVQAISIDQVIQGKFQSIRKNGDHGFTQHGYRIDASPLVVLNALGFIGFKVISVAGSFQVFL